MYSVERHVFNDTVRGFHPLNINGILNGNENWNTEVSMVWFRAVHGRKKATIRKRNNQATHLNQDTNGKVTTSQLDITNETSKRF